MKKSMKLLPLSVAMASVYASSGTYAVEVETQIKSPMLEVIEVTAQRKTQLLSEVPLAVTSVGAEAMADNRVENIGNISAVTPSVKFSITNNAAASANIVIRGLGTAGNSSSFEGGVGVFIDGVYRTRAGAALESFVDIGNLQVVRGPQGTLFGKNTSAGAILINSTKPTLDDMEGNYEVGMGNYGAKDLKAAINLPTSDTSALRIAAVYSDDDGYYTDVNTGNSVNGKETKALKAQWYTEVTDKLNIHVIADILKSEGDVGYATVGFIEDPAISPFINFIQESNGLKVPSNDFDDYEVALNTVSEQVVDDKGLVLNVEYNFDAGAFKSTTAYRKFRIDQVDTDADFTAVDLLTLAEDFQSDFFSQEFTFSSSLEGLNADYIVGAFYSKEDLDIERNTDYGSDAQAFFGPALIPILGPTAPILIAPDGPVDQELNVGENKSAAIFSHVTFNLNDHWKVITGLRYSEEEKTGSFKYGFYNIEGGLGPFFAFGVNPGPAFTDVVNKDEAISGTFGVQYFTGDNTMAYFTYNRGFKAGGVNLNQNGAGSLADNPDFTPGAIPKDPTFKPETVDGFELGLKSTYWDGRARTNIAAFYNEVEDLQVAQFVGLEFAVLNSESAKNYGLEFENMVLLNDVFSATFDATWIPFAEYGESVITDASISGQRMKYAPKVAANLGITFDQPISDSYYLRGGVKYQYKTEEFINAADTISQSDSVGLLNANLVLVSEDQGWQLELWAQNLTDENYVTAAFNSPAQGSDVNAYLGSPRTYGVTLRGSF
ncbi:TonB-dependent receptor [Paraglaciecola sp. 20A4]|uniref:TonB-dependent receptor n=1 Tax=Paraglaciecola sp. 20A4 TaxID=2687288 RepID=UPI00140D1FD1|nr:TonB-dependent receptor [Paraglaciecola sp. 20A4]